MIHYHGVAGVGPKFLATVFQNRHCFVSFASPGNLKYISSCCSSFAMDNGAFTAWRQNKPYDFNGFSEWVEEYRYHPAYDYHLIPDVIDGDERQNYKLIEQWKIPGGVPVWHMHESLNFFMDLCKSFPLVAIGSSGDFMTVGSKKWWDRMKLAMLTICIDGKPITQLHGLRMLRISIFTKLPFSSVDSTTVVRDCKYNKNWPGYNAPKSPTMRGLVIADRLESHQSAEKFSTGE